MKFGVFLICIVTILFGCNGGGESASTDFAASTTSGSPAIELNSVVPEENAYKQMETDDTDSYTFESDHNGIQLDQNKNNSSAGGADSQDLDAGSADSQDQGAGGADAGIVAETTGSNGQRNDAAQTAIGDACITEPDASILEDSGETVEEADGGENVVKVDSGSDATIQKPDVICDFTKPRVSCGQFRICEGLAPYCFLIFDGYSTIAGSYCGFAPLTPIETTVPLYCDDSCDCSQGQVCCSGSSKGQVALQSGRCADDCGTFIYGFQLCSVDEECPGQQICSDAGSDLPLNSPGNYFKRCVGP